MFKEINNAVNEVFLSGRFESRPLYLALDRRGRTLLADRLSTLLDAEIDTIERKCCLAVGASLSRTGDPYQDLEVELFNWLRQGTKGLPPFTALLFVLSHAAELMVSDGEFSYSNYYQRLSDITGVPRGRLSQFGITTEKFWRVFNNWLANTDFSAGRPTARTASTNKYVGLAMSQAIVSEEDRKRFHQLFEKYRFSSTDAITEEEIAQYIGNWIHGTRSTRQLKSAWAKAELRPRICEAAIAELRDWAEETGNNPSQVQGASTRLSMAVSFQHDLLTRSAVFWHGREGEIERVIIDPGQQNDACELDNARFASFATVEPRSAIPLDRVLDHGLQLSGVNGQRFEWAPRAVIPLVKSEKGNYWTEVNRVTMGLEHIVLVRAENAVRLAVESALEEIAQPGYTLSGKAEVNGLPSGWVLFEKVKVFSQLENGAINGFHLALSPVGATSGLQVVNGLKIGQGIWHEERPPSFLFDSRQSNSRLTIWDGTSAEGEELLRKDSNADVIEIDLGECLPSTGNIYSEGSIGDQVIGTVALLLRSAKRPRPLDRLGGGVWGHKDAFSTENACLKSHVAIGITTPSFAIEPSAFDVRDFKGITTLDATAESPSVPKLIEHGDRHNNNVGLPPDEILKLPCSIRGLHRYKYETERPGAAKRVFLNGECQDCGITTLFSRAKNVGLAKAQNKRVRREVPRTSFAPSQEVKLPLDLWFDAACFWGSGSLATFEALASAEDVDSWKASEALKGLSLLGHCDLGYSKSSRLSAWSVAPPSLALVNESDAILCGFRNAQLVSDLTELARSTGADVKCIEQRFQPQLIKVERLDHKSASHIFDVLQDCHGRTVNLVPQPSIQLADFCRVQGEFRAAFAPATIGSHETLQIFDLTTFRWRSCQSAREPGAYKISYAGTNYVYVSASRQAYRSTYELVKLAAARNAGVRLHSYDQNTRVFSSVLGCEPSGLLGRSLVINSGILPRIENGLSMFDNVPPQAASSILEFLYTGELPS